MGSFSHWLCALLLMTVTTVVAGEPIRDDVPKGSMVILAFNGQELSVRMNDSQASRDFIAMLPLTLTFKDYNATEKISTLPSRLSLTDSPEGHEPSIGDFTYYAPWGNVAIFYRNFHYGNGLVPLGVIEYGAESLARIDGEFVVHISRGE